jgi:hypothetical protein
MKIAYQVIFWYCCCAQDFYPRQVLLNGQACRLRISLDLNKPIPTVLPNGTLTEGLDVPVSITLGQLFGTDGEPLALKGINWCVRRSPKSNLLLNSAAMSIKQ